MKLRFFGALIMMLATFYCRKGVSDLESSSRSLLAVQNSATNSIPSIPAQNNEEKSTEVEAFDPLKPPRVRKKVTNRLSGKKKQRRKRKLFWISNNAGLFSHFFQVKYMSAIASNWNRNLVVVPYKSVHTSSDILDNNGINLCRIFNFTADGNSLTSNHTISCETPPKNSSKHCFLRFQTLNRFDQIPNYCYAGKVWGKSGIVPLRQKLKVMKLSPRLVFTNRYRQLFASVVQQLLSVQGRNGSKILTRLPTYCVVHWRRGDQLTSRCASDWKGLRDSSVNCGTVDDLIVDINSFFSPTCSKKTRPRLIFVATNERNETILDHLRLQGIIPLADVTSAYNFPGQTSLDEFIIETQFMLQADIFLSYGISQVNDVIEYERMVSGKGWCERDNSMCGNISSHSSWCQVFKYDIPA